MEKQALWSGRFDGEMDDSTLEFTSSLDVDVMLSFYDVMGSLAHVRMLKKCGIIPADDADRIIEGLKTIVGEMESLLVSLSGRLVGQSPAVDESHCGLVVELVALGVCGESLIVQ